MWNVELYYHRIHVKANINTDVSSFASLARLLEVLREKKLLAEITVQETLVLMQDRLEALVVALEVFFFKQNLSIEDFTSLVTNMNNALEKLGIPLDRFPDYIKDLQRKIDALLEDQLEKKKQLLLKDYEMTSESLQEYRSNKPLSLKIQKLERALADAEEADIKGRNNSRSNLKWLWLSLLLSLRRLVLL
jgi:hypothetical protein